VIARGILYEPAGLRLPLADDALLVALDSETGRLRVKSRAAGLLLAGALLAELAMSEFLSVDGAFLVVAHRVRDSWPRCAVLGHVLAQVERESVDDPDLTLADWLEYLALHAERRVARRLEAARILRISTARSLTRRTTRYVPLMYGVVAYAPLRLGEPLLIGALLTQQDAMLVALLAGAGLAPLVSRYGYLCDAADRNTRIETAAAQVAQWPHLESIARTVRSLIGAVAVASR
jgi:hypothetical protein